MNETICTMDDNTIMVRTNDYLFDYVFGRTEQKELLFDFVNSIVSQDPDKNVFSDVYIQSSYIGSDKEYSAPYRLYFIGKLLNGKHINVDILISNRCDAARRSLTYWAYRYQEQIYRDSYLRYQNPAYVINILTFNYISGNADYKNVFYAVNEKYRTPLSDDFRLFYLEMPKWTSMSIKARNRLEKWLAFLSNKNSDSLHTEFTDDVLLRRAVDAERQFMNDRVLMEKYKRRQDERIDYENAIIESEKKGEAKKSRQITQIMLAAGEPIEKIVKYTGLTIAEVEALRGSGPGNDNS